MPLFYVTQKLVINSLHLFASSGFAKTRLYKWKKERKLYKKNYLLIRL